MTSRTVLSYVRNVLEDKWEERIDGRFEPVPEPFIIVAATNTETRVSQYDGDVIFVRDGGPQTLEPKGVSWTHRGAEALATVDIRTQHSRSRLEGTRNADNESERYGGLRGEVQRIFDSVRKGDQEFDWIDGYEWNDLSEDVGFQFFRGTWELRLTQVAQEIDPEP